MDSPGEILDEFKGRFGEKIELFISLMEVAIIRWQEFDNGVQGNRNIALLSSLIYTAINLHSIAAHLFLSGFSIPSGNTQRQVIECIAMAVLGSKTNLGYLHRYDAGKFSIHKAMDVVLKKHHLLNVSREAVIALRDTREFYHTFSHPTNMTSAYQMSMGSPGLFFGASFDPEKTPEYEKEIVGRLNIAKLFDNLIEGIRRNAYPPSHTREHC